MERSRRSFIHSSLVVAGTAGLAASTAGAKERHGNATAAKGVGDNYMSEQTGSAKQDYPAGSENILGGATLTQPNGSLFLPVPSKILK